MRTGERRERLPNWAIGLILVVLLAVASFYAFTKSVPWADPYTVKAVFPSAANIRPASPVRIAGVNVGKVTTIEHIAVEPTPSRSRRRRHDGRSGGGGRAGDRDRRDHGARGVGAPAARRRDDEAAPAPLPRGQPVRRPQAGHAERAGGRRRPHLPGGPDLHRGPDRPGLHHAPGDVRSNLQILLDEFGKAFKEGGAEGFREIYKTSPGAFRYTSEVNEAFLGQEEHDLSELIVNLDSTVEALNQGDDLQDLVTNLRTVLGSFAAESASLEEAIALLPEVLEEGEPALASLNASFPSLRAFAREALPGVRSTPATLDAATPLLQQVRGLVSEDELRGLTADLRPTIPRLAQLSKDTIPFLNQARALSSCFNEVVIPWSQPDHQRSRERRPTGRIFEELGYGLVGLAGESRSNDANGPYIRVGAGSGANGVVIPGGLPPRAARTRSALAPPPLVGAIPAIEDSAKTPFRPDVPCETQEPPDLEATNVDIADLNVGDLGDLLPLPRASQSQLTAIEDGAEVLAEADELTDQAATSKKAEQAMEDVALALAGAYGMDVPEEDAKP